MQHDAQQTINDVLRDLPLRQRLTALVLSLLVEDASVSIENLIDVALIMTKRLPPAQRTSVVWHLNAAAEELGARWN
jgi:hypothetical protein